MIIVIYYSLVVTLHCTAFLLLTGVYGSARPVELLPLLFLLAGRSLLL
jgi:hypothetical protein